MSGVVHCLGSSIGSSRGATARNLHCLPFGRSGLPNGFQEHPCRCPPLLLPGLSVHTRSASPKVIPRISRGDNSSLLRSGFGTAGQLRAERPRLTLPRSAHPSDGCRDLPNCGARSAGHAHGSGVHLRLARNYVDELGLPNGSACLSAGETVHRTSGSGREFLVLTGR